MGRAARGGANVHWARREYLRVSARVPVPSFAAMGRGPALFGVKVDHTHPRGHVLLFIARMAGRAGGWCYTAVVAKRRGVAQA